ncbi:MAG: hypothetical protein EP343_08975 [Deltaproteobacteria bacterium]|nr:MAG: hypothetical protein EP343_08975 [Deltaproteobacteria bacterium]
MIWKKLWIVLFLLLVTSLAANCSDTLGTDACTGVDCGANGKCVVKDQKPVCECETGYTIVNKTCQKQDAETVGEFTGQERTDEPPPQDKATQDASDTEKAPTEKPNPTEQGPTDGPGLCTTDVKCPDWTECDPQTGGCKVLPGNCSSNKDCSSKQICSPADHKCKDAPPNPCASYSCSQGGECGLDSSNQAKCYCPNAKKLASDGKTCENDPNLADGNAYFCIVTAGANPTVRVYYKGLTESATTAPNDLKVEFGYTPYKATYPVKEDDYTWASTTFVKGGAGDFGNDVIYTATPPPGKDLDYIFRIAKSGLNWIYCHTGNVEPENIQSPDQFIPGKHGNGGTGTRTQGEPGLDGTTAESFACGQGSFDSSAKQCKCNPTYIADGITCVFDTFCQTTNCGSNGTCNLEKRTCDCNTGYYFNTTQKTCLEDPCPALKCSATEQCNRETKKCESLPACSPSTNKGQFTFCYEVGKGQYNVVVKYNGSQPIDFTKSQVMLNGKDITTEAQAAYQTATKTFVFRQTNPPNTKYGYVFRLADSTGKDVDKPLYIPFWVGDGYKYKDFTWDDGFMYYVMIDRFHDADSSNNIKSGGTVTNPEKDWKGGDWKGLTQKIKDGYFDKLGVNTIWISSPILNNHKGTVDIGVNQTVPSWGSYHAYHPLLSAWTHNFQFKGDPFFQKVNHPPTHPFETAFGTPKDLHEMINEAHSRGIRILLDFVTNHVHKDSPLYTGPNKKNWFFESQQDCSSSGWGISCTFTSDLPDIAYSSKDARDGMTAHAAWLVHELNVDGFRVDALKHMDLQFTKDMSTVMKAETETTGIPLYMVGETFTYDRGLLMKFVGPDKIQGQFDFLFYQAAQKILNFSSLGSIKDYIENQLPWFNQQWSGALMSNFIDNHDVARFNTGGKHWETRVALAVLLTSQQFPLLWQGTEYGMEQTPGQPTDPGNRGSMKFSGLNADQQGTLQFAQTIGSLRNKYIALRRGKRTTLQFEEDKFWVFKLEYNNETVYVAINGLGNNKTANNIPSGYTDQTGYCSGTTVPGGKTCIFGK